MSEAETDPDLIVLRPGMWREIEFDGRKVRMGATEAGGFYIEFERDGNVTPLHLSQKAMNALLLLHQELMWQVGEVSRHRFAPVTNDQQPTVPTDEAP